MSSWVGFWLLARADLPYVAPCPPHPFIIFLLAHCAYFFVVLEFLWGWRYTENYSFEMSFQKSWAKGISTGNGNIFHLEQNSHSVRTTGAVLLPTGLCPWSLPQQKGSNFSYTQNYVETILKNQRLMKRLKVGGFRNWHIAPGLLIPGVSHYHWP